MNRLHIEVDRRYPQHTLETTCNLLAMIADYVTAPRDLDMKEDAAEGVHLVMEAVIETNRRVHSIINELQGDERGFVQPMKPLVGGDASDTAPPEAPALTEPRRPARRAPRAA